MSIKPSMYWLRTFKSWTLTHEIKNPHYSGKNLPKLLVWTLSIWTPILALMTLHVASPQNITLKFIHIFTMMLSIWIVLYHGYVLPKFIDIFIMMFSSWIVLYHSFVYGSMISPHARSYPKRIHFWRTVHVPLKTWRNVQVPTWNWGNAQIPTWTWGHAWVQSRCCYFLSTFLTTMTMAITKSKKTRKDYRKGCFFHVLIFVTHKSMLGIR